MIELAIDGTDDSQPDLIRIWSKGNYTAISEELERIDWGPMFHGLTVDFCYDKFLDVINDLAETHVPQVERKS